MNLEELTSSPSAYDPADVERRRSADGLSRSDMLNAALFDAPKGETEGEKAARASYLESVFMDCQRKAKSAEDLKKYMSDVELGGTAAYMGAAMTGRMDAFGEMWTGGKGFRSGSEYFDYMCRVWTRPAEERLSRRYRDYYAKDQTARRAEALDALKTLPWLKHKVGDFATWLTKDGPSDSLEPLKDWETKVEGAEDVKWASDYVRNPFAMDEVGSDGKVMDELAQNNARRAGRALGMFRKSDAYRAALEERWQQNVQREYEADLARENGWMEICSAMQVLGDDARACVQAVIDSPDNALPESMYAKFNNLTDDEKTVVARTRRIMAPKVEGGFWNTIEDMAVGAANVGIGVVTAPFRQMDKMAMEYANKSAGREVFNVSAIAKRRQQLWQVTGRFGVKADDEGLGQYQFEQVCEDHGFVAEALIGAVTTLPYMAAAGVPYAGTALVALEAMDEMDDHVALNGGDISDPNYIVTSAVLGGLYAYTERLQLEGLLGSVSDMKVREALLKGVWKGMVDGRVVRTLMAGTLSESLQEGLQNGIMEVNNALALDEDPVRAFAEGFTEDFVNSLGTMFVVEAGGLVAGHVKRSGLHNPFTQAGRDTMRENRGKDLVALVDCYSALQEMVKPEERDDLASTQQQLMEAWHAWQTGGAASLSEKMNLPEGVVSSLDEFFKAQTESGNFAPAAMEAIPWTRNKDVENADAKADTLANAVASFMSGETDETEMKKKLGELGFTEEGSESYMRWAKQEKSVKDKISSFSGDLRRRYDETHSSAGSTAEDLSRVRDALENIDSLRQAWAEGSKGVLTRDKETGDVVADPGADALEKLGFTRQQARHLSALFHYERAAAHSKAALDGVRAMYDARMKGKLDLRAALAARFGTNGDGRIVRLETGTDEKGNKTFGDFIRFTAKDGTVSLVRIVESENAIDPSDGSLETGASVEDSTRGRITKEEWQNASDEQRRNWIDIHGLRQEGDFAPNARPVEMVLPSDPSVKVDSGKAAKLVGTVTVATESLRPVMENGLKTGYQDVIDNAAAFHEIYHAFAEFAKQSGIWTEEDNARLAEMYGAARTGRETHDEEKAAEAFRAWNARRMNGAATSGDERSPFAKLFGFAKSLRDAERAGAARERIAKNAEDAFFDQIMADAYTQVPETKKAEEKKNEKTEEEKEQPKAEEKVEDETPGPEEEPKKPEPAKPAPAPVRPTAAQTGWTAYTPTGNVKVSGHWQVFDLSELIHSNNPLYAQYMRAQLRNRKDNKAEEDARNEIVNNFQAERLLDAPDTANGAPIVFMAPDETGVVRPFVLSGNGRVMVLNELQARHVFDQYRNTMTAWAKENGIEVTEGETPVLVRVIDDYGGQSRDRIADLSNTNSIQQYTEEEQARADAEVVKALGIAKDYRANQDGTPDMTPGANDAFFGQFVRGVGDTSLYNSDRSLTQTAVQRAMRALMAIAVGQGDRGREVVKKLVEQTDTLGIQRQKNAVAIMAAPVAALESSPYAIGPDVSRAMADFLDFREKQKKTGKGTAEEYAAQGDLLDAPSAVAKEIFGVLSSNASAADMAEFVRQYCDAASNEDPNGGLFGPARTKEEIWRDASVLVKERQERARAEAEAARKSIAADRHGNLMETSPEYRDVYGRYHNADGSAKPGWLKAPNGKDTNLLPFQWVQVRTPSFMRWFGDWLKKSEVENAVDFAMNGTPVSKLVGDEFKQNGRHDLVDRVAAYFESLGGVVHSDELGDVIIDRDSVKSSLGHGIGREKAAAFAAVPEVIRNGKIFNRKLNWKNRGYDSFVFVAPITIGSENYVCEAIVEYRQNKEERRFYLHEVNLQSKFSSTIKTVTGTAGTEKPARPLRSILAKDFLDIKNDSVSKIVDENGEPKVVYNLNYSGDNDFTVFRPNTVRIRDFRIVNDHSDGVMFFSGSDAYQRNDPRTRAYFLNVRNPLWTYSQNEIESAGQEWSEFTERAKRNGNDGLVYADPNDMSHGTSGWGDDYSQFCTFRPEQIKSATDNSGAFDGTDAHVRHSISSLYTGTSADYDKPSLHYIGTGEGTQVYGHGLYATDNREIAEWYARHQALGSTGGFVKIRRVEDMSEEDVRSARSVVDSFRSGTAVEKIRKMMDAFDEVQNAEGIDAGQEILDAISIIRKNELGIDDVHQIVYEQTFFTNRAPGDESHIIIWDDDVSDKLKNLVDEQIEREGKPPIFWRTITNGATLYSAISSLEGNAKAASEFLARAGIDGIKYKADQIQHTGESGWNYVSFRDDNVLVDHKWVDGVRRFSITAQQESDLKVEKPEVGGLIDEIRSADRIGSSGQYGWVFQRASAPYGDGKYVVSDADGLVEANAPGFGNVEDAISWGLENGYWFRYDDYESEDIHLRRLFGEKTNARELTEGEIKAAPGVEATSDHARLSIVRADEIADGSRRYYEEYYEQGKKDAHSPVNASGLTREGLEKGLDMVGAMVKIMRPYLDKTKNGVRYLPEENYDGSTVFDNASYGKTIENSLICWRTLSYIAFTDAVKMKLGRPLTAKESFLASQMLYEIATEPQCLYCYVSLDRKAYDEFLKKYIEQRQGVFDAYNALDPARRDRRHVERIYQDFLGGRKNTRNMRNRFDSWIRAAEVGNAISMAEMTTREIRSGVKAEEIDAAVQAKWDAARAKLDGLAGKDRRRFMRSREYLDAFVEYSATRPGQMEDAEKYAQSASWAKSMVDYRSYTGEILKATRDTFDKVMAQYGLRFYSFSEYSPAFIVENMQQVVDAALRGMKGFAYTKKVEFARIFAPTGMNVNISCFGRFDSDGVMVMDERQGANWDEARALRDQYPGVGIVFVATDYRSLEWALNQDWIDVIIPFHIVRTGSDIAEFYGWENFTKDSADKDARGKKADIHPHEHRNDVNEYKRLIEERGLKPRFQMYYNHPGYMKLIRETRRAAQDTPVLQPVFDLGAAKASWKDFVKQGGYFGNFYKVDDAGMAAAVQQVADDVAAGKSAKDVDYGRQDMPVDVADRLWKMRRANRTHGRRLSVSSYVSDGRMVTDASQLFRYESFKKDVEALRKEARRLIKDGADDTPVMQEIRSFKQKIAECGKTAKMYEGLAKTEQSEPLKKDYLERAKRQREYAKEYRQDLRRFEQEEVGGENDVNEELTLAEFIDVLDAIESGEPESSSWWQQTGDGSWGFGEYFDLVDQMGGLYSGKHAEIYDRVVNAMRDVYDDPRGPFGESLRLSVRANPNLLSDVRHALVKSEKFGERADQMKRHEEIVFSYDLPFFEFLGLPNVKVVTEVIKIRKFAEKHGLSPDQIASLPRHYENPVAVIGNDEGGYVVLTDMPAKSEDGSDKPVMIVMKPKTMRSGEVVFIATAFSRNAADESEYYGPLVKNGLMYLNENKIAGLNLEEETESILRTQGADDHVLSQDDLSWWTAKRSVAQSRSDGNEQKTESTTDPETVARRSIRAALADGGAKEAEKALANYVAYFQLSHGGVPTRRTLARMGLAMGMKTVMPDRLVKEGSTLAEKARGTLIERAARNGDVATTLALLKRTKDAEDAVEEMIAGAASAGGRFTHAGVGQVNEIIRRRVETLMKDFTAASLADMEGETGLDIAAEILANDPNAFDPERRAKGDDAADASETAEDQKDGAEDAAGEDTGDEDESNLTDRQKWEREKRRREAEEKVRKFIEAAKARAEENRRRAEERRRKMEERRKQGVEDESGDGESKGAGDFSPTDVELEGAKNDAPAMVAADFRNPREFAAFLRVWAADRFAREHGHTSLGQAEQDKLFAEFYRICARKELSDLADKLLAPKGARAWVNRRLQDMEKGVKPDVVERISADLFAFINKAAIRESRADLVQKFKNDLHERYFKGSKFDQFKQDTDRIVTGSVEEQVRYIYRVCDLSKREINGMPSQLQQERAELMKIIEKRQEVYDESGKKIADAAAEDIKTREAYAKLALLDKYGAMTSLMPGQILDLQTEALQYLEGEAAKLEDLWRETKAKQDDIRGKLTAGVVTPNGQRYEEKGWLHGKLFDALNGLIRLRLKHLVRFADDKARADAESAINDVLVMLGDGEVAYNMQLQGDRDAFFQALGGIFQTADGKADNRRIKDYLKRMDEKIPAELAAQLSKQGFADTMTYGQMLQLLVSVEQRSFKEAVKENGREGQAELIRNYVGSDEQGRPVRAFTHEDNLFVTWLRSFYEAKRSVLSEVTKRMTGLEVNSPDPLYCPVRKLMDDRARGLHSDPTPRWDPISKVFSRRVDNVRDFDEQRSIVGMFFEASAESAKLVAWAERGSIIRNVFTSVGLQSAIRRAFGPGELGKILKQLEITFNGGETPKAPGELAFADKMINFTTYAYLGFNPLSAAKQTTSFTVWANALPGGFSDLWRHMTHFDRKVLQHLKESDAYKLRYGNEVGSGQDIATKGLSRDPSQNPVMRAISGAGMWLLKKGDFAPGAWIITGVYKDILDRHLKEGMEFEQADKLSITEAFNLLEETQQSGRVYNTNMLTLEHGRIGRLLTQFATSPLQQLQYETQAWREWRDMVRYGMDEKRIAEARAKFVRAAVINHVLLPAALNLVISAYKLALGEEPPWEKDGAHWTFLIEILMGQFSRVFFLGAFAQTTLAALFKRETPRAGQLLPVEGALGMGVSLGITAHDLVTMNVDNLKKDLERMIKSTAPTRIPYNIYRRVIGDSDADRKRAKEAAKSK